MKTTILSLVAFLLLGTASAFAQFSSTPMEPGLRDHLRSNRQASVQLLSDRKMVINGVSAEWVSQDQITLSAVVIELKGLTEASSARIAREILEYNVSGPVGTLSMEQGTIRMVHHLNPRFVTPAEITSAVAAFKSAVDAERANLDKSMATLR